MPLCAPMIGKIARAIFHHADSDMIKLLRAPIGGARFAFVLRGVDLRPDGPAKGDIFHVHIDFQMYSLLVHQDGLYARLFGSLPCSMCHLGC